MPAKLSKSFAQLTGHIRAYFEATEQLNQAAIYHDSPYLDTDSLIDETRVINALTQSLQHLTWQIDASAMWAQLGRNERRFDREDRKFAVGRRIVHARKKQPAKTSPAD